MQWTKNPVIPRGAAALMLAAAMQLSAADSLDDRFPVRGLCVAAPRPGQVDRFVRFIGRELAPRKVNTLILRVDWNFQYEGHPELKDDEALSRSEVKQIVEACRQNSMRVIPQLNLLGHQSWAERTGNLLRVHPEFDETPWVKMPAKHSWPNADRLYCKSYCPLHPRVHEVVFDLVDELCEVFEADAFHAGMDEVFYIGEEKCPRCSGKDKAELFAGEVTLVRNHLAEKGRKLWIWGDRLLDAASTGLGEWEASTNGTHRAVDLIPRDVVICDWHYERPEPTAAYFALKGFSVVSCPWRNPASAARQVQDMRRWRETTNPDLRGRFLGVVQTVWSGAASFLDQYDGVGGGTPPRADGRSEVACFRRTFEEMTAAGADTGDTAAKPPVRDRP